MQDWVIKDTCYLRQQIEMFPVSVIAQNAPMVVHGILFGGIHSAVLLIGGHEFHMDCLIITIYTWLTDG